MMPLSWQLTGKSKPVRCQVGHFPTLQSIDTFSPSIKQCLQDFKLALADLYGDRLVSLVLYGSFARHEETDVSDVDVLVVLKGDVSPGDEILRMGDIKAKLLLKYGELISVAPTSQADFLHRNSPLLEQIRQDGILV